MDFDSVYERLTFAMSHPRELEGHAFELPAGLLEPGHVVVSLDGRPCYGVLEHPDVAEVDFEPHHVVRVVFPDGGIGHRAFPRGREVRVVGAHAFATRMRAAGVRVSGDGFDASGIRD